MDTLIDLVKYQKDIIAWPIMLMLEKEIEYKGNVVSYSQDEHVVKAAIKILASIRSSTSTVLLLASQPTKEMYGKDTLPIARSIIEGSINTAYIMASGREVALRAIEHSVFKGFKNTDQCYGKGDLKFNIKKIPEITPSKELLRLIDQFTSKKGRAKNWTDHSVPERIAIIENSFKTSVAAALLTAYSTIYTSASEVVHGSVTGAEIGNGTIAFSNYPRTDMDHENVQRAHVQGSLLSCFISIQGVLEAFCSYSGFETFETELKEQLRKFKSYVREDSNWQW